MTPRRGISAFQVPPPSPPLSLSLSPPPHRYPPAVGSHPGGTGPGFGRVFSQGSPPEGPRAPFDPASSEKGGKQGGKMPRRGQGGLEKGNVVPGLAP